MNIIKKKLDEPATIKVESNSFLEVNPLKTHQKTIAVPRYSDDTVFHQNGFIQMFFNIGLSNIFIFAVVLLSKSHQAVRYSFFPRLTKSK